MADLIGLPWNEFSLNASPEDMVSENFRFHELTRSESADRDGIDNAFRLPEEVLSAVWVCRNVLQIVRNHFGRFSPNSVFRCQELERALKKKPDSWVSDSQHTIGQACDIEVPGISTMDLSRWVTENIEFDQVICECFNAAKGPNSGWVHVSLVPPGMGHSRGEILSYVRDPHSGKYVYLEGLHESPS